MNIKFKIVKSVRGKGLQRRLFKLQAVNDKKNFFCTIMFVGSVEVNFWK